MANSGRRGRPGGGGDHEHDRDQEYERREPEHSDRRGRDFPVFSKILGARWRGSAPPTAQAYARALVQWRQLPGAIGTTATDLGNAAGTAQPIPDGTTKKDGP
jgi:hypothetical protein